MLDTSKLDFDMVQDAVERQMFGLDNPGFCLKCGEEVDGCESDAREYDCDICDSIGSVYGAEELIFQMG